MATTLISKLEPGLGNPTIRLRVSRFWEFRDQNDENILYHLGLVLVDGTVSSLESLLCNLSSHFAFLLSTIF